MYGTVKAVHSSLIKAIDEKKLNVDLYFNKPNEEWKAMPNSLYDELMVKLSKEYSIDPPKGWKATNKPLLDLWGNRFQIWYKSQKDSSICFLVISCGPDGKAETDDDILSLSEVVWP